jgi:hypothetical protein
MFVQAARRRAPVLKERLKEKFLGAALRAVVLRAVVLRAVLFLAVDLRAVFFLALVVFLKEFFHEDLRAVVLRAGLFRAVLFLAVVLRALVLLAGLLRAVVLRLVRRVRVGMGLLLIPFGIKHEGRRMCRPRDHCLRDGPGHSADLFIAPRRRRDNTRQTSAIDSDQPPG